MLFSSLTFLFIFLPLVIGIYFISRKKYRNTILLIASLLFYSWGEPKYILLMVFSIVINYIFGRLIENSNKYRKILLITIVTMDLLMIGVFKYLDFGIDIINTLFKSNIPLKNIILPIGISFYTFQIMSYIIDVYRKEVKAQKNIINLGCYITLFPQLIAGPIVTYQEIENQLINRTTNIKNIAEGFRRFIFGLAKKVIIANQMAIIVDTIYANNSIIGNLGSLTL